MVNFKLKYKIYIDEYRVFSIRFLVSVVINKETILYIIDETIYNGIERTRATNKPIELIANE